MANTRIPSLDLSRGFAGKLIVAMPHLDETPFGQAVCLMCSHDHDHAFGVIVNKPMAGVTVAEVVAEMDIIADEAAQRAPVYFGGPVDLQRGAVLHSLDYRRDDTVIISDEVGLTATKEALAAICDQRRAPRKSMLIMGHAGWDGGQLEDEIKRNDWLSIQASFEMIFGDSAEAWSDALMELGINDLTRFDGNENPMARPN